MQKENCTLFLKSKKTTGTTELEVPLLARHLVEEEGLFGGSFCEDYRIARGENGKPFFLSRPELQFNVSDTGDLWACVFASVPVGLDLQKILPETKKRDAASYRKLAARWFHPEEVEYVESEDSLRRFFAVWSAREARVKCTGSGLCVRPKSFCVLNDQGIIPEKGSWIRDGFLYTRADLTEDLVLIIATEWKEGWEKSHDLKTTSFL